MDAGLSIPVWCIIDVPAILNDFPQGGTLDSPAYLGAYAASDKYISMVTQQPYVDEGDGSSELGIKAPKGSTIQLMANTFAQPSAYSVLLVAATPNREPVCTPFVEVDLPNGMSVLSATVREDVDAKAYSGYDITILIGNPFDFKGSYCYKWDPKITVAG
jgi:hypothetical protein